MAYINDEVFDQGLDYATTTGTKIDILSADPGSSYAAIATTTLGNDTVTTGITTDATSGRKVVVTAITAGSVTATGTATYWALSNGTAIMVASGILTASQAVTLDNTFTLDAIDINILDATSV